MIRFYIFHPPHRKNGFYEKMGMFFAERIYRSQLPDLVNSSSTTWVVVEKDSKVIGFGSYEQTNLGIEIGEIYTVNNDHQLWQKIASKISILLKKKRPQLIYTSLSKKEKQQLKYFNERGFYVKRENKNFYFLEKDSGTMFSSRG